MSRIGDVAVARLRTVNPEQIASTLRTIAQGVAMSTGWAWLKDDYWISGASFVVFGLLTWYGAWYARRDKALLESAAAVPAATNVVVKDPAVAQAITSPKVVSFADAIRAGAI